MHRRDWLKQLGMGSMSVLPATVLADASLVHDTVVQSIVGHAPVKPDDRIALYIREHAENGAVVPVGIVSDVPDTRKIVLLVDGHARTKVAEIDTSHAMLVPRLSTHIQLTHAATLTALVETPSGWHVNSAQIKSLGESCEQ